MEFGPHQNGFIEYMEESSQKLFRSCRGHTRHVCFTHDTVKVKTSNDIFFYSRGFPRTVDVL